MYCNQSSRKLKEITYIPGEIESIKSYISGLFGRSQKPFQFFAPSKDWEKRSIIRTDMSRITPSGLRRIDLYLYAIETNTETNTQIVKSTNRSSLSNLKTPIEWFYSDLWDDNDREYLYKVPFMNEPFENAMSVANNPKTFSKKFSASTSQSTTAAT